MSESFKRLPYDPTKLERELRPYYIGATKTEQEMMYDKIGKKGMTDLYSHLPKEILFDKEIELPKAKDYSDLQIQVETVAAKNRIVPSFIGDGLPDYKIPKIVEKVSNMRGLATAYTPYQPERSQGTLTTLWMYSSALSALTGFEAVNASMYDRSTAILEAINSAIKLAKGQKQKIILANSLYPADLEVLKTLTQATNVNLIIAPICQTTGRVDHLRLKELITVHAKDLAALVFPQVNAFGLLEDVNTLTDLAHEAKISSIAVVDPMLLGAGGLVPPSLFGTEKKGVTLFVGEGQHLAIAPNFGGPGLGIFGIRFNEQEKNAIRSTPGRFIGKAKDEEGRDALAIVLSTREQHIRRESATSNICSNEAFIATLAGAALLERGDKGMEATLTLSRKRATQVAQALTSREGVELAFPTTPSFNELTFTINRSTQELIEAGRKSGLHIGVDISYRAGVQKNLLLISLTDKQSDQEIEALIKFFETSFPVKKSAEVIPPIPAELLRTTPPGLPQFSVEELTKFYSGLDEQNISPDDTIYPLGSCTMKYNPYINEYAASLKGVTELHPEAPLKDAQGSLEILYMIQEMFKTITGLHAVTTQPVAGAHGEWLSLKLFQAYHAEHHKGEPRDTILIPSTAHGTNPASATMSGLKTATIRASQNGQIDTLHLQELIDQLGNRVAGIMVTNPNTAGVFETRFKEVATMVKAVGGLIYMDGANLNAISGFTDLGKMDVDAVHSNLHKTWSIPHGGGGPGDAIVAVSSRLADYLPGIQVVWANDQYELVKPAKSIGSFHRHFGNFAHKMRTYTYLLALGGEGVRMMSANAVLSSNYLYNELKSHYPVLPENSEGETRMHEFILTLEKSEFEKLEKAGVPKANAIARVGKLFLDFGLHAPTVAFPEVFGLMIEPTESYTKKELDRFVEIAKAIKVIINEHPEVLTTVPHFTPISKVDELSANKTLILSEKIQKLPTILPSRISARRLATMSCSEITKEILAAHNKRKGGTKC